MSGLYALIVGQKSVSKMIQLNVKVCMSNAHEGAGEDSKSL